MASRKAPNFLKQVEVVQLVAVLHDVPLDLTGVDPGHEVFHVSSDSISFIRVL